MTRIQSSILIAVGLLVPLSAPALSQSCQQVNFPDDFSAGVIEGQAPSDGIVCCSLNMAPHDNNLDLSITGRNTVFGFDDGFNAGDALTEIQMVPEGPEVRVTVSQLMRSPQAEDFRLTVKFLPPGNG